MRRFTMLVSLLFCVNSLFAGLDGHWEGKVILPTAKLDVNLDFHKEGDAWQGDISIPAQGAKDLNLINIEVTEGGAQFEIEGVPGKPTFKGTFSENGKKLAGDFEQGGGKFTFELSHGENLAAKAKVALKDIDTLVNKALEGANVVGLGIAVVVDDQVILSKGYGYRDLEKKWPVTKDTLFAIGSSSKAFTTAVIGSLVDEGKLDWDKPVIEYMPDFRLKDQHATFNATVRDIVTHRIGLPRHDFLWYNSPLSREEIFQKLAELEPNYDIREKFYYQNLMYMTAGLLVERVTGNSWEEEVKKRIFEPLGMTRSNFSVVDSQKDADHSLPYEERDRKVNQMNFRNIDQIGPAGSINSSVDQMTAWLRMQLNHGEFNGKTVLKEDTVKDMQAPHTIISGYPDGDDSVMFSYGLGWFIEAYRGKYLIHHGGNIDGFTAMVAMLPLDNVGVVILSNKNGTGVPSILAKTILDTIVGLEDKNRLGQFLENREKQLQKQEESDKAAEKMKVEGTKSSHDLAAYVGKYENSGYGVVTVEMKDGRLLGSYNNIQNWFNHWHYNVFSMEPYGDDKAAEDTKVQFRLDMDGNVTELGIVMEMSQSAKIFKRLADDRLKDPEFLKQFVGDYDLGDVQIKIALHVDKLTAKIIGQPLYTLVPDKGLKFKLSGLEGFSVEFLMDGDKVTGLRTIQPNGVFEAKRVEK